MSSAARDAARQAFKDAGLTLEDALHIPSLRLLINRIDLKMKQAGLMDGSLRMRRLCKIEGHPRMRWASIRCKAFYFDNREAVTFNDNGFIGFAGWAADENTQPILDGFLEWVSLMADAKSGLKAAA